MYELIWFKVGMMIDTIEPYILVLIRITLTIIKVTVKWKTVKTSTPIISQFSVDLLMHMLLISSRPIYIQFTIWY